MERLLARLERRLGRFAIPNLTLWIVGGMALTFLLIYLKPEAFGLFVLDKSLAPKQPWRFISYLFLPESFQLIWVIFTLYWTWLIGTNLENEWGSFKLNVYYLLGILGTTAAAWITGLPQTNIWLNTSLFFAFATIFPDYEILLFFIIPIRVKWLALLTAAGVGYYVVIGDNGMRAAIAVALVNYFLFFGMHLLALAKGQRLQMKQAVRRTAMRADRPRDEEPEDPRVKAKGRVCAICGKAQEDGADIRVCNCEKCGGVPRELCLEHARSH
jgi:membrane associated rhomboid family serine protease